jgi:hypothetical protein
MSKYLRNQSMSMPFLNLSDQMTFTRKLIDFREGFLIINVKIDTYVFYVTEHISVIGPLLSFRLQMVKKSEYAIMNGIL